MADESAATPNQPITPETTMDRLKEIGERDSATRTEQPSPDVNGAAVAVTPAAPAALATTPAADDEWWNGADVSHAMLRTASSKDVETMFQNAQKKIREQGELLNRQRAAPPAPAAPAVVAPARAADVDPRIAEFELVQYTDTKRAAEIQREWSREAADERWEQRREQEADQQRVAAVISAKNAGVEKIATDYKITDLTTLNRYIDTAVIPQVAAFAQKVFIDYGGESGDPAAVANAEQVRWQVMQDADNYLLAFKSLHEMIGTPEPKPTITVPAVPKPADPPHSTAAAPPAAPRKVETTKKLSEEQDRSLTKLGGLSEEGLKRFKERVAASA